MLRQAHTILCALEVQATDTDTISSDASAKTIPDQTNNKEDDIDQIQGIDVSAVSNGSNIATGTSQAASVDADLVVPNTRLFSVMLHLHPPPQAKL